MKKLLYILFCLIFTIVSVFLLSSCSITEKQTEEVTSKPETVISSSSAEESRLSPESETQLPAPDDGTKTICLDAGHGYVDPGCSSDYLGNVTEDIITDEITALIGSKLEERGYRVIYLRDNDNYVDASAVISKAKELGLDFKEDKIVDDQRFAAYNRSIWINVLNAETKIDMAISFHADAFPEDESICGTRIHYCKDNDFSSDSANLCELLADELSLTIPDQKPRAFPSSWDDAYIMTKYPVMASALIEMGFATNKTDAANLLSAEWRENFADGICEGIDDYFEIMK